jgi:hypothetical protein
MVDLRRELVDRLLHPVALALLFSARPQRIGNRSAHSLLVGVSNSFNVGVQAKRRESSLAVGVHVGPKLGGMQQVEDVWALALAAASTKDDAGAATVELELADRVVEARAAHEAPAG